jgi:hypothetical protein
MKPKVTNQFPPGWDDARVREVIDHYEGQSEDEAVAEDEAAFAGTVGTLMAVPPDLVPEVRQLISDYEREKKVS